jgi:hypothetical protein
MVDEDVITGSATDKTIALFVVKPLYCALFFHSFLYSCDVILRWQELSRIAHSLLFTPASTLDPFSVTAVADHVKT